MKWTRTTPRSWCLNATSGELVIEITRQSATGPFNVQRFWRGNVVDSCRIKSKMPIATAKRTGEEMLMKPTKAVMAVVEIPNFLGWRKAS